MITTYLMKFTEPEIEAIYTALEVAPANTFDAVQEVHAQSVIDKCCADRIGPGAHFNGAIGVLYDD